MQKAIEKAAVLIKALPYIQRFRGKPVVVKFGGAAMESDGILRNVLLDVVFMEQVGMSPILVHGGGQFITNEMAKRGKEPTFVEGHRVTDQETLDIAFDVLVGQISAKIVDIILQHGGRAKCVWDGASPIKARKHLLETRDADGRAKKVDIGLVGTVTEVDVDAMMKLCREGIVPVVPPITSAEDIEGGRYNVQADLVAVRLAKALNAEKLVFLSNTHGILRDPADPDSYISSATEQDMHAMIADGTITGGMLPKARAALEALEAGVRKTHIIDGRIRHSLLLEIFTDEGIGTQIVK